MLAKERTRRKDPLDNRRYYTGGWNITNKHYFAVRNSILFGVLCCLNLFLFFFRILRQSSYKETLFFFSMFVLLCLKQRFGYNIIFLYMTVSLGFVVGFKFMSNGGGVVPC